MSSPAESQFGPVDRFSFRARLRRAHDCLSYYARLIDMATSGAAAFSPLCIPVTGTLERGVEIFFNSYSYICIRKARKGGEYSNRVKKVCPSIIHSLRSHIAVKLFISPSLYDVSRRCYSRQDIRGNSRKIVLK